VADLLSVKDAQEKILAVISPTDLIEESLESTSGKYLGKDIIASMNLPPFDNSSMDGFAVQSKDTISSGRDHPITLRVIDDIPAGKNPNIPITPGSCARIMTGAPIPQGADAVIKYEDTDFNFRDPDSSAPLNVNLYHEVQPGDNIRTSGEDICIGDLVLERKTKLRPQGLG